MATKKLQILDSLIKQAENADTLDGKHADEFAAASDVEILKTQDIGSLDDLTTSDKSSIVAAINEIVANSESGDETTVEGYATMEVGDTISKLRWIGVTDETEISFIRQQSGPIATFTDNQGGAGSFYASAYDEMDGSNLGIGSSETYWSGQLTYNTVYPTETLDIDLNSDEGSIPWGESPNSVGVTSITITSIADWAKPYLQVYKTISVPKEPLIKEGYGENSIQGASAISAGQMAFSITAFDTTAQTYTLDSVEGLEVGMRVSIQLKKNYDDCGTIAEISGNDVKLSTFYYTEGEDEIQENSSLRALDYPELGTWRFGTAATALGYETKASSIGALSAGYNTEAHGKYSAAFGNSTKAGFAAISMGRDTNASGRMSLATGDLTTSSGQCSISGGYNSMASGDGSVALGNGSTASGYYSTARGENANATNQYSIATGKNSIASGIRSYARGLDVTASNIDAIATGQNSVASGVGSFAHGLSAQATGNYSTAIGEKVTASGNWSFAAPYSKHRVEEYVDPNASNADILAAYKNCDPYEKFTLAKGGQSVALGRENVVLGAGSVAIGYENISTNWGSATMGRGLISTTAETTTVGRFNNPDDIEVKDAVFIVGIGSNDSDRKNGFWVDKNGNTSLHAVIDEKIAAAGNNGSDIIVDEYLDDFNYAPNPVTGNAIKEYANEKISREITNGHNKSLRQKINACTPSNKFLDLSQNEPCNQQLFEGSTQNPILVGYDIYQEVDDGQIVYQCNDYDLGTCVFYQYVDGVWHVISDLSFEFLIENPISPTTKDKELLAVITNYLHWGYYVDISLNVKDDLIVKVNTINPTTYGFIIYYENPDEAGIIHIIEYRVNSASSVEVITSQKENINEPNIEFTELDGSITNLNLSGSGGSLEPGAYFVTKSFTGIISVLGGSDITVKLSPGDWVYCEKRYYDSSETLYEYIIRIQSTGFDRVLGLSYENGLNYDETYYISSPYINSIDWDYNIGCQELPSSEGTYTITGSSDTYRFTFGDIYDGTWHEDYDENGEDISWYEALYLPINSVIIVKVYESGDCKYTLYDIKTPEGAIINLRKIENGEETVYTELYNSTKTEENNVINTLSGTKDVFSIDAGKYICENNASLTWECLDKTIDNHPWNSGTISLNYGDIVSVETCQPEVDYHQINIRVRSNSYDASADSVTSYSFLIDPASDKFYEGNIVETYIRLPEITSADEGKILQVVNGQLQLVSLPAAEEASF